MKIIHIIEKIKSIDFVLVQNQDELESKQPFILSNGHVSTVDEVRQNFLHNLKTNFGLEIFEYESKRLFWKLCWHPSLFSRRAVRQPLDSHYRSK